MREHRQHPRRRALAFDPARPPRGVAPREPGQHAERPQRRRPARVRPQAPPCRIERRRSILGVAAAAREISQCPGFARTLDLGRRHAAQCPCGQAEEAAATQNREGVQILADKRLGAQQMLPSVGQRAKFGAGNTDGNEAGCDPLEHRLGRRRSTVEPGERVAPPGDLDLGHHRLAAARDERSQRCVEREQRCSGIAASGTDISQREPAFRIETGIVIGHRRPFQEIPRMWSTKNLPFPFSHT